MTLTKCLLGVATLAVPVFPAATQFLFSTDVGGNPIQTQHPLSPGNPNRLFAPGAISTDGIVTPSFSVPFDVDNFGASHLIVDNSTVGSLTVHMGDDGGIQNSSPNTALFQTLTHLTYSWEVIGGGTADIFIDGRNNNHRANGFNIRTTGNVEKINVVGFYDQAIYDRGGNAMGLSIDLQSGVGQTDLMSTLLDVNGNPFTGGASGAVFTRDGPPISTVDHGSVTRPVAGTTTAESLNPVGGFYRWQDGTGSATGDGDHPYFGGTSFMLTADTASGSFADDTLFVFTIDGRQDDDITNPPPAVTGISAFAVPEPSRAMLLSFCLAGLCFRRRR